MLGLVLDRLRTPPRHPDLAELPQETCFVVEMPFPGRGCCSPDTGQCPLDLTCHARASAKAGLERGRLDPPARRHERNWQLHSGTIRC